MINALKGGEWLKIKLRAARVNAGLTQEQFAEAVGVSKLTVSDWERGKRRVKIYYLPIISRVLGVPVDDIILPTVITNSNG